VEGEDKWTSILVADFDQHKSAVGRVEWNVTGTILSSAGDDGRVRLWKATSGNVWRPEIHFHRHGYLFDKDHMPVLQSIYQSLHRHNLYIFKKRTNKKNTIQENERGVIIRMT